MSLKDAIFSQLKMQVMRMNNAKDAKYSACCQDFVSDAGVARARVFSFVYSWLGVTAAQRSVNAMSCIKNEAAAACAVATWERLSSGEWWSRARRPLVCD